MSVTSPRLPDLLALQLWQLAVSFEARLAAMPDRLDRLWSEGVALEAAALARKRGDRLFEGELLGQLQRSLPSDPEVCRRFAILLEHQDKNFAAALEVAAVAPSPLGSGERLRVAEPLQLQDRRWPTQCRVVRSRAMRWLRNGA